MAESFIVERVLANGEAVVIAMEAIPVPRLVYVVPGAGDTVTVQYSPNGVDYQAWDNVAVTAYSNAVLNAPVASIKFQRTAGSGTTSKVGVR